MFPTLTDRQRANWAPRIANATIFAYGKLSNAESAIWRAANQVHDVDVVARTGWAKCQRCDGSGNIGIANVHCDRGVAGGDDIPHYDPEPCTVCGGLGARWPVRALQSMWGWLVDVSTLASSAKSTTNRFGIFLARAVEGGAFDAVLDIEVGSLKVTLRVPANVVTPEGEGGEG